MRSRIVCQASRWLALASLLSGCGLFVEDWRVGGSGGAGGAPVAGGGHDATGGHGGGSSDGPEPVWCRFYGTAASESLWDLRPDVGGLSLIGAAGISGPITLGSLVEPSGTSDGILVRFDGAGEPTLVAQLGASQAGVLSTVLVADPPLGGGYYVGTAGAFGSTPAGRGDAMLFDAGSGPLIAAGTSQSDQIVDGDARGDGLVFTGPSGAGIDFGTGPAPGGGFIAFASRASGMVERSVSLGAGSSAGVGHMARFSPAGDVVWASALLGEGLSEIVCDGEQLVTVGPEQSAILKLSPAGVCLAGRVLPIEILKQSDLAVREDGGIVISGRFTESFTIDGVSAGPAESDSDAFVAIVDPDLTFTALLTYGGAGSERPNEVIIGPDGSTFVAGEFSGAMTVGTKTVASVDDGDVYVLKLDASLAPTWLRVFAGSGLVTTSALTLDGAGNLFLGGSAEGSLECASPAPESAGSRDMFLMRFDAKGL